MLVYQSLLLHSRHFKCQGLVKCPYNANFLLSRKLKRAVSTKYPSILSKPSACIFRSNSFVPIRPCGRVYVFTIRQVRQKIIQQLLICRPGSTHLCLRCLSSHWHTPKSWHSDSRLTSQCCFVWQALGQTVLQSQKSWFLQECQCYPRHLTVLTWPSDIKNLHNSNRTYF